MVKKKLLVIRKENGEDGDEGEMIKMNAKIAKSSTGRNSFDVEQRVSNGGKARFFKAILYYILLAPCLYFSCFGVSL